MLRYLPVAVLLSACVDTPPTGDDPEVITTVELTFTPAGGGTDVVASWADPENDGSPVIDSIVLLDTEDYALSVAFLNELEDPAEDITAEIEDEAEHHQIFFTGTALDVITVDYADTDSGGLPIGLANDVTTDATGTGELTVTLRHLPDEGGVAVKVAGLAETVAADGDFSGIPGDTDASVTFPVTVE